MRVPRIYEREMPLEIDSELTLSEYGAGHVSRVLRLKVGDKIRLFNGLGHEFFATLTAVGKKTEAKIVEKIDASCESPIYTELLQVISRGDRMEYTIQKAVELGINRIVPLTSERCGVKLDGERALKKVESYQKIAIAACEQCGRNVVPEVAPIMSFDECLRMLEAEKKDNPEAAASILNLTLDPRSNTKITALSEATKYRLLVGPEGGFSDDEVSRTLNVGFTGITLGPRILRTETAALVALSVLGATKGDL